MDFIPEEIEAYCQKYSDPENEILSALNRETHANFLRARMLSGHLQGTFLKMISCMIKPSKILEIGTYTGYSAICLAEGLQQNGILHTIDVNYELEDIIRKYIHKANLDDTIELMMGDALEIIPKLNHSYDLVFIDADKNDYIKYFELVIDKVVDGGFIIADNVLWRGKVLNPAPNDVETNALIAFNEYINKDKRIENLMLPFRDGLMIMRKKYEVLIV